MPCERAPSPDSCWLVSLTAQQALRSQFRTWAPPTLENSKNMAAHASVRTTQLYNRRRDDVTLDEVVKINIRG